MSSHEQQISHQELGDALNVLQQMINETPQNWEAVEGKAIELRKNLRHNALYTDTDLNELRRWSECALLAGNFLKECTDLIQHTITQQVPKSFPNENGAELQQAVDTEDRHASAIAKMQSYVIKLCLYMNPTYFLYLQESKQILSRLKTAIEAVFSETGEWELAEEETCQLCKVISALIGYSVTKTESQHWDKCMNTVTSMLAHIQKASELSNIIEESTTLAQRINGPSNASISQSVLPQLKYYDQVAKKAKLDYHKLKTTVMDELLKLHHLYIHPMPPPVKEVYPEDSTDLNFAHIGFIKEFTSTFEQLIGEAMKQIATMKMHQYNHTTTQSDLQKMITDLSSIISTIYEEAKEIVTSIATWRPQGFQFPNFEQGVKTDRWLEFETWGKIECLAREILQSAAKANKFVTNMHRIIDMMGNDTDDYRKMEQNSLLSPLVKQIEGFLLNIYKSATQLPGLLVTHEQTENVT
jgi:truncated hemoglobin YjbI